MARHLPLHTLFLPGAMAALTAIAQPPLDEVACYSFTGDATDGSGNGHDGVVVGPSLSADRYGATDRAYAFDGVDDHIEVADFSSFGIVDEVSVGVWVRANIATGNFAVSLWPDDFNDRFSAAPYYSHLGGSTVFWDFGDCTDGGRSSIIPYAFDNTWGHFVFTSSAANNRMRIYFNGALILEQFSHSSLVNVTRALELGGGNVPGYSHWEGDLDEIVIYDRELTGSEALDLFTYGAPCQWDVGVEELNDNGPVLTHDAAYQLLNIRSTEPVRLELFDAAGRTAALLRFNAGQQQWSTAAIPPGVYFARSRAGDRSWVHKVVVE